MFPYKYTVGETLRALPSLVMLYILRCKNDDKKKANKQWH